MWALQILIWSIPFGFVNSVTQYVLIAVDQQRFLTRAFVIGVVFNIVTNLIFIPRYSYLASATITILSELALLLPFYYGVRKYIGPVPWHEVAWRPAVAAAGMGIVIWLLRPVSLGVGVVASFPAYLALLWVLGAFATPDVAGLLELVPWSRRKGTDRCESSE
jgi:O-antigen/teichoic acid export membrane protein